MKSEKHLRLWQERLEQALAAYSSERARMTVRDSYYGGAREVYRGHETGRVAPRRADNVRNIVYELIESEVDPSVPMPRVEAVHPGDEALAKRIEDMLRSLIREQSFSALNDLQERTVPIQGGAYWSVEWDAKGGSHCALGSVSVGARHPQQIVPQPGVCELEEMDYLFLCLAQPCTYLRRRYGVTLKGEGGEDGETAGMCMQNIAYYRNGRGGIGLFSWAEGEVLADYEDYGVRRIERCTRCGALREGEVCACGNRSFREETQD